MFFIQAVCDYHQKMKKKNRIRPNITRPEKIVQNVEPTKQGVKKITAVTLTVSICLKIIYLVLSISYK